MASSDGNGNGKAAKIARWLEKAAEAEAEAPAPAQTRPGRGGGNTPAAAEDKPRFKTREERDRGTPVAVFTRLSDVKPREYDWLWPDLIPIGEPVCFYGDCDVGKSMLSINLASTVSTGGCWPDRPGVRTTPGDVIFLADEDTLDTTVRPRVDAARGDPGRIHALEHMLYPNGFIEDFSLSRHGELLAKELARFPGCRLLVLDPVTAYLGGIDGDNTPAVRVVLRHVARAARSRGIGVLLINHPNKSGGIQAKYRATGSSALVNAPRAAYYVAMDPDDQDRRLVAPVKYNLGPWPGGLAYRFEGNAIAWEADRIPGLRANHILAREAFLLAQAAKHGPAAEKRGEAIAWLQARLQQDPPVPLAVLVEEGREPGFSRATIERALRELKARKRRDGKGVVYELR